MRQLISAWFRGIAENTAGRFMLAAMASALSLGMLIVIVVGIVAVARLFLTIDENPADAAPPAPYERLGSESPEANSSP
ncbi:MAG: hypothetical protein AAGF15_05205 [Pseudomonadota bacterium]